MSDWRLPLPLDVVAPKSFAQAGVARSVVDCYGPGGSVIARLRVAGEGTRRKLGVLSTTSDHALTLEDADAERSLTARYRNGVGAAYHPPIPPLEFDGDDVARWRGFEAILEDARGERLGSARMRSPVSNEFLLRGTTDQVATVRLLSRRERRAAGLRVSLRRVALRMEGAGVLSLDARLVLVWAYAIAMRDASR